MEEIDHLGIVGGHPLGARLASLAEADAYCVHRFGFEDGETRIGRLGEMPYRVRALCICASGAPGLFRAVAEYLRLSDEHRPAYLLNMTPVNPVHARRIDAFLRQLAPAAIFAEAAFLGGMGAVEDRNAIAIYGSRSGPPDTSVESFLLRFAARIIEFRDVPEASAARLVIDVASLLVGLAAHEASVMGRNCGISRENLVKLLSPGEPHWSTLNGTHQVRLLTESCELVAQPPLVGEID